MALVIYSIRYYRVPARRTGAMQTRLIGQSSRQVQDDSGVRYARSADARVRCIFCYPVFSLLYAFVYSGLILAYSHRKPAISTTAKRIAHQNLD